MKSAFENTIGNSPTLNAATICVDLTLLRVVKVTWGITISGSGTEKEFKREERIKASSDLLQTFETTMVPLPQSTHKIGHCGEDQSLVQMISSLKDLLLHFGRQRRYIVLGWAAYINKEETKLEVELR